MNRTINIDYTRLTQPLIAEISITIRDSSARLFGSIEKNPKYRNRLPLPVLAARLHSSRNYACCEEVNAGGEGQCEKDMIIVWVAGLDIGDTADRLRCSIQVHYYIDSCKTKLYA